jgi:hypothetical protein
MIHFEKEIIHCQACSKKTDHIKHVFDMKVCPECYNDIYDNMANPIVTLSDDYLSGVCHD